MEFDVNERDMADLFLHPREEYHPDQPRHYKFKKSSLVQLMPMYNLLVDDDTQIIVDQIRAVFKTQHYVASTTTTERTMKLGPQLRRMFVKFLKQETVDPVEVTEAMAINEPSPTNVDKPSVMGLETVLIKQELRDTDYLYRPTMGFEQVALSIYFGYDHVPVIIDD